MQIKNWLIAKLEEDPDYWKDVDTYKDKEGTRYQIQCYVNQVDSSNYLRIVSECLSIIKYIMLYNEDISFDIDVKSSHTNFRVVFTFTVDIPSEV